MKSSTTRSFLLALLLSLSPCVALQADEANDAWTEIAKWMKESRPNPATKSAMKKYRKAVAKKLEGFVESYPSYFNRSEVELLLGETYIAMKQMSKAKKLFEDMAASDGDRAPVGRVGVLKVLCSQRRLSEARKRLNVWLKENPDDESLHAFDEFLRKTDKSQSRRKGFRSLKRGKPFPEFSGSIMGSEKKWSLAEDKGRLTLLGFWMSHSSDGKEVKIGRKELGIVKKLHTEHKGDLTVLGIPYDRDQETLKSYLSKHGLSWPQLANGPEVCSDLGVSQLPEWILLDSDGRVIARNLRGSKLEKTVKAALKKIGG